MDKITRKKKVTIETQTIIENKSPKYPKSESKVINDGVTNNIEIVLPKQNHKDKRGKIPPFLKIP